MSQNFVMTSLVVHDYDEAIAFYVEKLGFVLLEDTRVNHAKRWVRVAPKGTHTSAILIAKAANEEQRSAVGNQTGGRVFLFLHTDDIWRDYHLMTAKGVQFVAPPREEPFGVFAVFEDLYGTKWDLIQPILESL